MAAKGWKQLIPAKSPFSGKGKYPLPAYSEYMPPPRLGWKPYSEELIDQVLFQEDDPWGWHINEFEEGRELQPGLLQVARQVMSSLVHVMEGKPAQGCTRQDLVDNPYWPKELAEGVGQLKHERMVLLTPLALSRTQDDKGRIRWTLFGSSEQGPAKPFWQSFYQAPSEAYPVQEAIQFICRLLNEVYGEHTHGEEDLHRVGFRIMKQEQETLYTEWQEGELPGWSKPFVVEEVPAEVKYLLTFRRFELLPATVRQRYLQGDLLLLPYPGSLVFWGMQDCVKLHQQLPLAMQIPLLQAIDRHQAPTGLRVPQAGILHDDNVKNGHHQGKLKNTYRRSHRWQRVLRDQDELSLLGDDSPLVKVLFSNLPDDVGLYGKPMARNVQLWTLEGKMVLDGPNASLKEIQQVQRQVQAGNYYGYRFVFPAMEVGKHKVFWHRPMVAYRDPATGLARVVTHAPLGYITAYDAKKPQLDKPVTLWPRVLHRAVPLAALAQLEKGMASHGSQNGRNLRQLYDAHLLWKSPLPRSFAEKHARLGKHESFADWWKTLTSRVPEAQPLVDVTLSKPKRPISLTYTYTGQRSFEVEYWKTIASLAEGIYLNKNVADCVGDEVTASRLTYQSRQLEALGDHILDYYRTVVAKSKMQKDVLVGELPFRWQPECEFSWSGAWLQNKEEPRERNLVVVIPGKDRQRTVIMADHYDTAYMEDCFDGRVGKEGARLAACGADDNHSATAALMLAAPIFMKLSKQGKLAHDIWLVHLTGEEFPSDCMGARHLIKLLVEKNLILHLPRGKKKDLSKVKVEGVFDLDMIAHNQEKEPDIFQIASGTGSASQRLAYQAHMANMVWNDLTTEWNQTKERKGKPRGRRSPHGSAIPDVAAFLPLTGEVRPTTDRRSALFNTDGQVFSDAGIPCVLFMENYDINRSGYHDTHDTMANIDLDYGAALAAITIETVARVAAGER